MELPRGVTTVEGALEAFTSVEHLKGSNRWCCNVCKKLVEADKNLTIFKVRWGGKGKANTVCSTIVLHNSTPAS